MCGHSHLNVTTADSFDPWPVLARGSDYHSSARGVAVVLGYPVGQVRAELELAKQSFDVGRGGGPASGHDEGVVGDLYASEGYRYSAVHMKLSSGKGAPATPPATTDGGDANAMVIVKNEYSSPRCSLVCAGILVSA